MSGGESQEFVVDDGKRTPSNCACCWRALVDGETETCRECGGVCCDGCCFLGLCDDCSVDEDEEDWDEDDDLDEDDIEDDGDFDDLEDDGELDDSDEDFDDDDF
jgi:hypothetical protein